ncbi:bifunctional 4-hydroxy-2-oxoglutarate aldolase/2-dehydro-3-deoxy-phosphogluconate aldolase [Lentibacillus sp. N15]|uniref:bifunctional 4-hydroxy-2-oxoglutarate aldolase/2-dehydro-3-deoxy-phosphogluconate aldolase n=1 Tax=Lentibacillus songyuanensis TaxID=3136161 RepID=UPI0031BB0E10
MASIQQLVENPLVAIMRGVNSDHADEIIKALKKGGIKAVEITLDSLNACEMIRRFSKDEEMLVGAGTVLDPESARAAIQHGAKFIVAPTLNLKTIEMSNRYGVISIPGCLTPTEILTAYEHGADMVKIFPAGSMGAGYFKNLSGPLGQIPLMATGGISESNLMGYIKAGVTAVGLGSSLVPKTISETADLEQIVSIASRLVQLVNSGSNQ